MLMKQDLCVGVCRKGDIPNVDEAGFVCRCMQEGRYTQFIKQDLLVVVCRKGDTQC